MESLRDKNVFIAGATGGIGTNTAKLLKQSGAILYLAARDEQKLSALAVELEVPSNRTFIIDVKSYDNVITIANSIHQQVNSIDILINATGVGIIKPLENLTSEDFSESLSVNLVGAFNLLKAFLPNMKEKKTGLIINLPGVLGKTPMAGAAAYSASKYGLNGMLKSVREELKRTEIRITNIFLGGTDTPFWDEIDLRVQKDKFVTAEEAAKSIWFLCQQPSSGVVSEMVLQPFNHQAI
ncbi:MAG: SDR family oxidoreductase [bacterium]|jgi:short-subunit dehydrogenase